MLEFVSIRYIRLHPVASENRIDAVHLALLFTAVSLMPRGLEAPNPLRGHDLLFTAAGAALHRWFGDVFRLIEDDEFLFQRHLLGPFVDPNGWGEKIQRGLEAN
jgi:hypothetical protein